MTDTVAGGITGLVGDAADTLGGIASTVAGSVADVVGGAVDGVADVVGSAVGTIVDVGEAAVGTVTFLADGIVDSIATTLRITNDVLGNTGDAIRFLVGGLVDSITESVGHIADVIGEIPGFVNFLIDDFLPSLGETLGEGVGGLAELLADPVKGIIGGFLHGEEPDIINTVNGVYARLERNRNLPPEVRSIIGGARSTDRPLPALIGLMILPIAFSSVIGAVFQPVAQLLVQEENIALRPTRIGLADAVQAEQRDLAGAGYVADVGSRAGYPDGDIEIARKLGETQPTVGDLVTMVHREIIGEGDLTARLRRLGYSPDDAARFGELVPVIPPLQDLVRFAVREAFPGQTGYGGARGSAVPGGFTEAAKHQGLSPEFARSYWAAHWELPSFQMAAEMYHRGIIDLGRLQQLILEADYAPEWRDNLIELAFNPLTRVDVRRMYDTGVISLSEVEKSYRDLGYSPENAARLAEFTDKLKRASGSDEEKVERDLTRADVVGAYTDGITSRVNLLGQLSVLGYDPVESELIADRADFAISRANRTIVRAGIVASAKAGTIDTVQVQAQMSQAGFKQGEIDAVLADIQRAKTVKATMPAKADWKGWLGAKIVTEVEARQGLSDLGYSDVNVERYIKFWSTAAGKLATGEA